MDYKLKYEKYKLKYINLKNNLTFNQNGGSTKPTLYLFKAEWCGHCNRFKSEWEKLINNDILKKEINFITMDSEINKTEMNEWKIEGFPTIILQMNNNAIEYSGNRTFNEIEKFIYKNI